MAVLGGDPADRVVQQCRKLGFEGDIWPVHPTRAQLGGLPCVASLDDLPGVPDAVFIGVNRLATIEALRSLRAMGGGGAVCYGSGFSETGDDDLQAELVEAAGDVPFFGPNCYGFVNTFDRVALWPDEHGCGVHERGAAIVSQSGNVAVNLTFQRRGLRLATMITVGNQAVLGAEDAVEALLDDDRVTAIGLFLEALRDPHRFAAVSQRAHERGVPIVALQTGRSAVGATIAASHTGSMAGRAAAYDALFARCGVPVVRTPAELLETLKLFDHSGVVAGRKAVSLSCSGGEASLVADLAEATQLCFESFADEHRTRIEATLDDLVSVSNPFDYHTFMWGDRAAMATTFRAVMDGPQDVTMLVLDAPSPPDNDPTAWYAAADALADAADATQRRAVVVATMAECMDETLRTRLLARGVTPLLGLAEGLAALDAAATVAAPAAAPHAPVFVPTRTRLVDEASAKVTLRDAGISVPEGVTVGAVDSLGVQVAAARIGYPITLKALGHTHKSEAGAVKVGIADEAQLDAALATMPAGEGGYLVERTVTDVVAEVLVTVRRDPPVGWLVTVGHGGVTTELWHDAQHLLAPVDRASVLAAIGRLRSAPLLQGFRGRPPADVDALADLIVRLSDWAVATGVVEVELNPVLVGRDGAVAVDALLIVEA